MLFYLKVLQAKERAPTHFPSVLFTFGFTIESIKEFGVHQSSPLKELA
jgi:hypothetical protein